MFNALSNELKRRRGEFSSGSPLTRVSRRVLRIAKGSRLLAVFDVHGTLLEPTWRQEYIKVYSRLTAKSEREAVAWVNSLASDIGESEVIKMLSGVSGYSLGDTRKSFTTLREDIRRIRWV